MAVNIDHIVRGSSEIARMRNEIRTIVRLVMMHVGDVIRQMPQYRNIGVVRAAKRGCEWTFWHNGGDLCQVMFFKVTYNPDRGASVAHFKQIESRSDDKEARVQHVALMHGELQLFLDRMIEAYPGLKDWLLIYAAQGEKAIEMEKVK